MTDLIHPHAAAFRHDGRSGSAFVLVHGFAGNPAHFRPLGRELNERGNTVIAPLLPGHGTRLEDLVAPTGEDWIGAVVDAIRQVGDHRKVHLVGLSMGGLLSIMAARRTTIDTITTINTPIAFRSRRIHLAFLAHRLVPRVLWPEDPPPPMDQEVREFWIHLPGFPTVAGARLARLSYAARWAARHLDLPSLVIQSRTDQTVHPRSGRLLSRALGDRCRLLWLEDSIHNALFDSERHVIRDAIVELTR